MNKNEIYNLIIDIENLVLVLNEDLKKREINFPLSTYSNYILSKTNKLKKLLKEG